MEVSLVWDSQSPTESLSNKNFLSVRQLVVLMCFLLLLGLFLAVCITYYFNLHSFMESVIWEDLFGRPMLILFHLNCGADCFIGRHWCFCTRMEGLVFLVGHLSVTLNLGVMG
jgi:hypothetical protein